MVEYNYIDFAGPVQLDSRFKERRGIAAPVEKEKKEEDSWADVFRGVLYGYAGGTEEAQELLSPSYTPSMEKDPFLDQQLELLKSVNIPKEDRTREVFPEVVGGFTEEGLKREVEKLLDENKQIASIDDTSITDSIVVPTDQGGEDSTAKKVIEGLGGIMSKPVEDAVTHSGSFDNKEDFLKAIIPVAKKVGEDIGLDWKLIVAQSAIETGWGSKVKGNSFFGVKGHGDKDTVTFATTEEVDGKLVKTKDTFRAYDTLEDSVKGYGQFLLDNPRYADYLAADSLEDAAKALQKSGYATDSQYGKKVLQTAKGKTLSNFLKDNPEFI